jgi:hypothetical protein
MQLCSYAGYAGAGQVQASESGPQGWPGVNMWHVGILSPKDRADR